MPRREEERGDGEGRGLGWEEKRERERRPEGSPTRWSALGFVGAGHPLFVVLHRSIIPVRSS